MRDEEKGFVTGIATGRVPAPGAHDMSSVFQEVDETTCVYDCGRKVIPGKDCCRECLEEAHRPLDLERK